MIEAFISLHVECCGNEEHGKCHIEIDIDFNPLTESLDVEEFLSENGWLYINEDTAYCPNCRFELHD